MSIFRWILALLVIGLVGMAAVNSLKPHEPPPVTVRVEKAQRQSITSTVRAAGKLEPVDKVNVSSNITGILLDLKVGIGSTVKKGQYLGQIDTSRYRFAVEQQRAQLQAAEADVKRQEAELDRLKNISTRIGKAPDISFSVNEREQARTNVASGEAQLALLRSRVEAARAQLTDASKSLEWSTLRAPVDGTVLSVNHRVGERIRGSDFSEDVVLVLGSLNDMEVRIDVGEHDVVHIRRRQHATVTIDALPKMVLEGDVIDSGRDAVIKNAGTDNEVTNYPVWVAMKNPPPGALSGMSSQVTIYTETKDNAVVVPIQAVTVRPRDVQQPPPSEKALAGAIPPPASLPGNDRLQKVVFVVKDGKVEKRAVETGISSESMIEITSGLSDGEAVVEGPYRVLARDLKEGTRVEEEKPGEAGHKGGPPVGDSPRGDG